MNQRRGGINPDDHSVRETGDYKRLLSIHISHSLRSPSLLPLSCSLSTLECMSPSWVLGELKCVRTAFFEQVCYS